MTLNFLQYKFNKILFYFALGWASLHLSLNVFIDSSKKLEFLAFHSNSFAFASVFVWKYFRTDELTGNVSTSVFLFQTHFERNVSFAKSKRLKYVIYLRISISGYFEGLSLHIVQMFAMQMARLRFSVFLFHYIFTFHKSMRFSLMFDHFRNHWPHIL